MRPLPISEVRGVNVSSLVKNLPCDPRNIYKYPETHTSYRPFGDINEDLVLGNLRVQNINTVRLMLFWESLEPSRDQLNYKYLIDVDNFIKKCASHNLYVILDFHQDLWARRLGGSGAPDWTLPPTIKYKKYKGVTVNHTLPADKTWGARYVLDPNQKRIWKAFLNDEGSLQGAYINYISRVCKELCSNRNILAIDLFNEPSFPELFLLKNFLNIFARNNSSQKLSHFYERAIKEVISVIPESVKIGIEPFGYDVSMMFFGKQLKIKELNLDTKTRNRIFWAPHLYVPAPIFPWAKPEKLIAKHIETATELGLKDVLFGEFGDLTFNSGSKKSIDLIRRQADALSRSGVGFIYYNVSPGEKDFWCEENMSMMNDKMVPSAAWDAIKSYFKLKKVQFRNEIFNNRNLEIAIPEHIRESQLFIAFAKYNESEYRALIKNFTKKIKQNSVGYFSNDLVSGTVVLVCDVPVQIPGIEWCHIIEVLQ